jgi:hypothetical protein
LAKTPTIKPEEVSARNYVDRLILEKLTEMESAVKLGELAERLSAQGIGLSTVRSLLASNPERFAYHERRWIPAARIQGEGRPFAEVIAIVLHRIGGPMPWDLLVVEVGRIRSGFNGDLDSTIRRVFETDPAFLVTRDGKAALAEWGFVASDESIDRALALNDLTMEEVEKAEKALGDFDWRAPGAVEQAVHKLAPIRLKVLAAVAWKALNSQDPRSILIYDEREFLSEALSIDGIVYTPDGLLAPDAEAKRLITTATKLADRIAPTIDVEEAAPIDVSREDVDRIVARILGAEGTTTTTRLLEEFYEVTPANKTFPDDMANLMSALRGTDKVQWVGGDRFRKAGDVPDYIVEVPEPFQFVETENRNEEGELVDVELTDEGLSSSLRKLLTHPLAMDVLDEDPQPAPKAVPESARLVLKSIHRELGTFPLAQFPTNWLAPEPPIQELIFIDPTGRELQVWMNGDARLMYNLFDWWYEQPVESGAVFTITRTPRPNVFEFEWMDQPDPVVYISSQRMEELRQLGIESEGKSTFALLMEVMGHWPKGADYLTILAEVNVVRRSSRRLIASLLSSYQCFYQRSGSPVWHFDAKKVDQGFDKTKRKFVKK